MIITYVTGRRGPTHRRSLVRRLPCRGGLDVGFQEFSKRRKWRQDCRHIKRHQQRKRSWFGANNLALWEQKSRLEARAESGTRAKTVLGKTLQEEMKGDILGVIKTHAGPGPPERGQRVDITLAHY